MTQIEYRTAFFPKSELRNILQVYGDDGWILSAIADGSSGDSGYLAIFYRPVSVAVIFGRTPKRGLAATEKARMEIA